MKEKIKDLMDKLDPTKGKCVDCGKPYTRYELNPGGDLHKCYDCIFLFIKECGTPLEWLEALKLLSDEAHEKVRLMYREWLEDKVNGESQRSHK